MSPPHLSSRSCSVFLIRHPIQSSVGLIKRLVLAVAVHLHLRPPHLFAHPPRATLQALSLRLGATATAKVGFSRRVAGGADDRVDIVAVVVTGVDGVLLVPSVGVQRAVGAEGSAVLGQDVAGEEVAGLVGAVGLGVLDVPLALGLARRGAERGVVRVVVEQTHAVVCVVAVAQEGRVDGGWEARGRLEAGDSGSGRVDGLGVTWWIVSFLLRGHRAKRRTVAAGDDDVEVLVVLSVVGSGRRGNGVTVDGALDVGDGVGVSARRIGRVHGVALVVDVEAETELLAVTEIGTGFNVVLARVDVLVCEVTNLLGASSQVGERLGVAVGSGSVTGVLPQSAGLGSVLIDTTSNARNRSLAAQELANIIILE
jgi:hypothetical protein